MIERLPGCLRVRPVYGDWHAVFRGNPELVRVMLAEAGYGDVRCTPVPLEELFVELVGRER
jgi:hypothetical protein